MDGIKQIEGIAAEFVFFVDCYARNPHYKKRAKELMENAVLAAIWSIQYDENFNIDKSE
jgi:hypothetical protein